MNAMTSEWKAGTTEAVASLPMYDLPELQHAHDALWAAIHQGLLDRGLDRAPATLLRGGRGERAWREPRVLLTQTCGYPLALGLRGAVHALATPGYRARGCRGPYHRSVIVVRLHDKAMTLAEGRGRRLAINTPDSNTGVNLLRADIAPLAAGLPFFATVIQTGGHARSVAAVAEGLADLAAVDCVTWALLERTSPALCRRLRVLAWSRASLGLPLITGALTTDDEITLLRQTLDAVALDPTLKAVRHTLLLERFHEVSNRDYESLASLQRVAAKLGYEDLS